MPAVRERLPCPFALAVQPLSPLSKAKAGTRSLRTLPPDPGHFSYHSLDQAMMAIAILASPPHCSQQCILSALLGVFTVLVLCFLNNNEVENNRPFLPHPHSDSMAVTKDETRKAHSAVHTACVHLNNTERVTRWLCRI